MLSKVQFACRAVGESGFATGAGLGTIAATLLTGIISDRYSFAPVLLVASVVPLLATAFLLTLIRSAPNSLPSPARQTD